MKKLDKITYSRSLYYLIILFGLTLNSSCKKFVEVDPPIYSISQESVFNDNLTASAVLTGIYSTLIQGQSSNLAGFYRAGGLSADEYKLYNTLSTVFPNTYYMNKLSAYNDVEFWASTYTLIYRTNSAIEGISASSNLTPSVRDQLLGEAKFMRGFFYFYLVNLYGDVPLALQTDYKINASLTRAKVAEVYKQIVQDLNEAKSLLRDNYLAADASTTTIERLRPNKAAAAALLARVYLYTQDYAKAEIESTFVIENKNLYDLTTLAATFLKNSKETIWALQPVSTGRNTNIAVNSIIPASGPTSTVPAALSDYLINAFEVGDQRKINWVRTVTVGTNTYPHAYKYKVSANNQPVTEYTIVLRLAEQYLIRSESRLKLGKSFGQNSAESDLNIIRTRAGLMPTIATNDLQMISAIEKERQVELFTEWGSRWLDLKRTGRIDAVMPTVTPTKNGIWKSEWKLYPIPIAEIRLNPNLTQNPGYEN